MLSLFFIAFIELSLIFGLFILIILAVVIYTMRKRNNYFKEELAKSQKEKKKLSAKIDWQEIFIEQLLFLIDNIPEGIVSINKHFKVTFYNKTFSKYINDYTDKKETNIFDTLGFSKEDQTSLIKTLGVEGKIRFTWLNSDKAIYNVRMREVSHPHANLEYGMVLEDISYFKEEEKGLMESLDSKKKELITKMMQISKRNADLERILGDLKDLYKQSNSGTKLKLSKIINRLNNSLDIEDGWKTFNKYFQEIQPNFLEKLQERSDGLTNNDIRHCMYLRLGLSNKEIAQMFNISFKSVETTHYRIKKKLSLPKEETLRSFIGQFL